MDTENRSPLALRLLILSAALGIAGDILLEIRPWGLSVPVFAALVLGACVIARKYGAAPLAKSTTWLALATIPIAGLFAWRDADGLRALNGIVLFLCVGMVALRASLGAIYATSLADLLAKGPVQWLVLMFEGPKLAASDIKWKTLTKRQGIGRFAAVGRGLMLAVLPVSLFVVLLSNSDAIFQHVITPNFSIDPDAMIIHIGGWFTVALLAAGFFRKLFLARYDRTVPPVVSGPSAEPVRLGITEISTVLIALNAVVGLFVAIQFRYLFGGSGLVHSTIGMSYAQYARRGFFELLTVVALSIPILMAMNGLLNRDNPRNQKIFRCSAGLFVVQIFIVAASALDRMKLYVDFYSLSPLRLYAVAGMAFMIGFLGLFLGTTLRGRSDRFAFGWLVWLATVVIGLNVINPDAMIAKYNLQDHPGYSVDADLLASLSSDATPVLIDGLNRMQPAKRQAIIDELTEKYEGDRPWQTQTLSYHAGAEIWKSAQKQIATKA